MNSWKRFLFMFAILLVLSLVACIEADDDSGDTTPTAGKERTEITGSVTFDLRYTPAGTFVMGEDVEATTPVVTLTKGYWMAETEVTYKLWHEVYTWAIDPALMAIHLPTRGVKAMTAHPETLLHRAIPNLLLR
jgi:hypothetical protein